MHLIDLIYTDDISIVSHEMDNNGREDSKISLHINDNKT